MIHYNTKNKNFLRVHETLSELGIKNNKFMLQLNNEALLNIDPFNNDLSKEECKMILQESISNFWYFAREIVKWRTDDGISYSKLDLGSSAMYYCTLEEISSWRTNDCGPDSFRSIQTILLWYLIKEPIFSNKIISQYTIHGENRIIDIYEMIKLLPNKIFGYEVSKIKGNKKSINNNLLESSISVINTPRGIKQTDGVFHGDNSNIVFFQDAEFIKGLQKLVSNIMPAMYSGNKLKVNIFNSGYNTLLKNEDFVFSQEYIESMIKWKETFYDLQIYELINAVKRYGNNVIYIKHKPKDLYFTDNEISIFKNLKGDDIAFRREVLLERV